VSYTVFQWAARLSVVDPDAQQVLVTYRAAPGSASELRVRQLGRLRGM